ncbi:hypothetical protein Clacol_000239 [Clathrus columnatus]|uniref:Probable enoyl-CoA hydratase, mitochondrial n=1 Tax=Clathrus columnatus TaxID=1419009 RepID=A0AAV5A0F1_9AGAM|nr:hypothetical protein Clacol_000239 [Clathrus columnatus]
MSLFTTKFTSRVVLNSPPFYLRKMARNMSTHYQNLLISRPDPAVLLITLNRPKALNALNKALITEIHQALDQAENDPEIGSIVLTGSERAFAAGADIKEMKDKKCTPAISHEKMILTNDVISVAEVYKSDFLHDWSRITRMRKPTIAAVSGYALGGGCELAMMCDIILASPTAVFGQPEINLGIIPGAGGTQRLTHAIGKSRAMELILTGRDITAQMAEAWGLVSRVVGDGEGEVVKEAVQVASTIASKGQIAIQAAKEAVNASYQLQLEEGLRLERRLFHSLFATKDQKEGMTAFAEKRKPVFTHL